jgi:RNA polymerase sigma-70 factor (ECF subfamily)
MEATLTLEPASSVPMTADSLCLLYAARVARFAALMCSDRADAEDLAQEALYRAVRGLRTYDQAKGPVDSWLWTIVANAARDAAGRRRRLRDLVARLTALAPREVESVEDEAIARIGDSDLRMRLRALSLRDQTLLALRYGADLETAEVAAAIGIGTESASRAIRRALARLRALLEEESS